VAPTQAQTWNRAGSLQKPDMPRFFAKNENALYNLVIQG
jgi:hypothetical protein